MTLSTVYCSGDVLFSVPLLLSTSELDGKSKIILMSDAKVLVRARKVSLPLFYFFVSKGNMDRVT